jgi:hypothetical protein
LAKNKIGEEVAMFYEAWAIVLETKQNYAEAEKVYAEGIRRHVLHKTKTKPIFTLNVDWQDQLRD